jgi:LPXTG-motif cell wall-anchored protein
MVKGMRLSRIALAAVSTACALSFVGAPAAFASTDLLSADLTIAGTAGPSGELVGQYAGLGFGLTDVIPDSNNVLQTAGEIKLSIEGQTVNVFCIQMGVPLNTDATYTATSWEASSVPNLPQALDIALRHDEIGTPLASPEQEAAATQVAMWTQTSGADVNSVPNTGMRARINELVAGSDGDDDEEPMWRAQLSSASSAASDGSMNIVSTVASNIGPVEGVPVLAASPNGTADGITGEDGQVSLQIPTGGIGTVAAAVSFDEGVVMKPETGQLVIVTDTVLSERRTDVPLDATVPAPPNPEVSPEATPEPAPTADNTPNATPNATPDETPVAAPEVLPHTGSSLNAWVGIAALFAAVGGGAMFVWSRMRPSDTR